MNGKLGMNNNMSEAISLALEPIANEYENDVNTNATDGLISDIKWVNKKWDFILEEEHQRWNWMTQESLPDVNPHNYKKCM